MDLNADTRLMKTHFRVMTADCFRPEHKVLVAVDDDGEQYVNRRKVGDTLACDIKQERNYVFHSKAMKLVRTVHDALPDPDVAQLDDGRIVQPQKNFEATRAYLTIAAGYYDVIGLPNGKVRLEPKSWAFNKMTEVEFEEFYQRLIDAALEALPDTWSQAELERVATDILHFA